MNRNFLKSAIVIIIIILILHHHCCYVIILPFRYARNGVLVIFIPLLVDELLDNALCECNTDDVDRLPWSLLFRTQFILENYSVFSLWFHNLEMMKLRCILFLILVIYQYWYWQDARIFKLREKSKISFSCLGSAECRRDLFRICI